MGVTFRSRSSSEELLARSVVRRPSVGTLFTETNYPTAIDNRLDISVCAPADADLVSAAEQILRRYGARVISLLTSARAMDGGRTVPARLSANDCYVAMDEACRKMARVALRKYRQSYAP